MSHASDYLETQIGTHLFLTGSWTKPDALYVALFTVEPADAGTGGTEVTGGSYARVACGPGDAYWTESPTGTFKNANAVTFPAPTADWGDVAALGLYTAASAGTLLVHCPLVVTRTVLSGDQAPSFAAGDLAFAIG